MKKTPGRIFSLRFMGPIFSARHGHLRGLGVSLISGDRFCRECKGKNQAQKPRRIPARAHVPQEMVILAVFLASSTRSGWPPGSHEHGRGDNNRLVLHNHEIRTDLSGGGSRLGPKVLVRPLTMDR